VKVLADADDLPRRINGLCKLPGKDGAKMRRIDVLGASTSSARSRSSVSH